MLAELNSKRLELLHQIVPDLRRIAVIANPLHPGVDLERRDSEAKARQLGIEISFFPTANKADLDRAFDKITAASLQGMLVFSEGFVVDNRQYILNFAMSRHIPVVSGWAVMAQSGAICTYGPRLVESYRRVAYLVDRILQGAKPVELPIEQPTALELVVNVKSAKILGSHDSARCSGAGRYRDRIERSLLRCMCPLLAQSRHPFLQRTCPLSGVKRT